VNKKVNRWSELAGARRCSIVQRWIKAPNGLAEHGMGERFSRAEQLEHRVQMLLGVFPAKGVLPLEFKPAYSVGDLLTHHLDDLEEEAEKKGGIHQALADQFA
jgi:hypothetical protein